MLGFILGAACVVFVARAIRRRHAWHGHFGYGAMGCGRGLGYGPPAAEFGGFRGPWNARGYGGRGRGGRARWALRALFERLETTPGQERAIAAAIDELRDNRNMLHDELGMTRSDVARAVEGGLIEDATLEETFARQDRSLARLRVSFTEALKKVTEVLDERQRKELAGLLEGGFWRSGPFGRGMSI